MSRVLVVEDDPDLARGLKSNLEIEGHEVDVVGDGLVALDRIRTVRPDLVVLDLMLPGLDGLRVLSELRRADASTPVLVLTARESEGDKVRGLRLGADDYVTKPFGLLELIARIEALLRRRGTQVPSEVRIGGDVVVQPATRTVTRSGAEVSLRPLEYELLLALLRRRGAPASRAELLREVWGYASAAETRTVDTHVFELRRKLEADPAHPRHLVTVWRVGYRLVI